jgi:hypothetical protein
MANNCALVKGSYNVPANRSGCITVGSKHGEQFEMNADFMDSGSASGAACSCCEYRQYVRGVFRYRALASDPWITVNHLLRNGVALSFAYFNEDGFPDGGAYGYRAFNGCSDSFLPLPRATGCQYRGTDFPGLANIPAGNQYEIYLEFRGAIVDVCNSETQVQSSTWTVDCRGVA